MLLIVLAYLGGALTILSPCILPVLPFVFARADQPFVRSGLPLLAGMALTFALVATLAAVGGGLGHAGQPVRPLGRHRAARRVRPDAAVSALRRSSDAPARERWKSSVEFCPGRRSTGARGIVVPVGHRDGSAVGALRRPDPRFGADRRGVARRECRHDAAAGRLCGGCGDFACHRAADWRPGVHRDEALARRGGMDPPRHRRSDAGRCGRDFVRSRHGRAGTRVDGGDGWHRAKAG